ncbi:putative Ig domain-containing protein [Flavobacterium aquidurense]|uniref:putative Ig domain-containing protein n=1 Tax=Flavobacterium aquidurense TaxID=362413 RepID=UPI002855F39F|nr:putative Ig domain-containing protein [Flavobacterium aquidurense]MDR7372881.1 hypothetical protein [Flavobacterium aquidurense]
MKIIKYVIFAIVFFTIFDVFAQHKTTFSEPDTSENTDQNITKQYVAEVSTDNTIEIEDWNKNEISEKNIPPSIEYQPIINTVVGIVVLDVTPSNTGGEATLYTISPALPRGLFLNPATGVICGIPMEMTENDIYTIAAINESGKSSFETMLVVNPPIDEENTIFIQMKEYPNPLEDFLRFDGENGIRCVEVYNVLKQLVYFEEYNNFDPLSRKLVDLSKFGTGEYLLTLFKDNEVSSYTILNEESSYTMYYSKGL